MVHAVGVEGLVDGRSSVPVPTALAVKDAGTFKIHQARAESMERVHRDLMVDSNGGEISGNKRIIQDPGGLVVPRRSSINQPAESRGLHRQAFLHLQATHTNCLWFFLMAPNNTERQTEGNSAAPVTATSKQQDKLKAVVIAEGSSRRPGKELMAELGTEEEKKAIVINMAKARRVVRGRFLAVGIFLSMLTVTSKQLVDSMKKVWRIRGNIDTNPLPGRRFLVEFFKEGDFNYEDIHQLKSLLPGCSISNTRRSLNTTAHELAKLAKSKSLVTLGYHLYLLLSLILLYKILLFLCL